jgi:hypothetical protein
VKEHFRASKHNILSELFKEFQEKWKLNKKRKASKPYAKSMMRHFFPLPRIIDLA